MLQAPSSQAESGDEFEGLGRWMFHCVQGAGTRCEHVYCCHLDMLGDTPLDLQSSLVSVLGPLFEQI